MKSSLDEGETKNGCNVLNVLWTNGSIPDYSPLGFWKK